MIDWRSFALGACAVFLCPWALLVALAAVSGVLKALTPRRRTHIPEPILPAALLPATGARARVHGATDEDVVDNLLESLS